MKSEVFIPKEKEKSYFYVPFKVPENAIKISVRYSYLRTTKGFFGDLHPTNTIDIGLADEKGNFLGWSGSAHESISVGEFESSSGYPTRKITPGEWNIIVGAYHVLPQGVTVTYEIDFEEKKETLLFGDLHIHSVASDGKLDFSEIAAKAIKKKLDYIAVADHNNFCENFNRPKISGLSFIPAVEWTHYNGHMNFFGVKNPFENSFIANNDEEMRQLVDHARTLGATISVNHPKCRFCPFKWKDNKSFDMMEIWNGPMRKTNIDAIAWWTEMLREGRHLPIVGGSDFHRPRSFAKLGNPVTAVYSASRSDADILAAIRAGRGFVTSKVNGVKLNLSFSGARLGETTEFEPNAKLNITAENLFGDTLILVTSSGEKAVKKHAFGNVSLDISIEKTSFVYLKSVKGFGTINIVSAITNPIYFN